MNDYVAPTAVERKSSICAGKIHFFLDKLLKLFIFNMRVNGEMRWGYVHLAHVELSKRI